MLTDKRRGAAVLNERKRRETIEALRELLADLHGYNVGRVSLRGGRMIVWLRYRAEQEPAIAIKLLNVVAFRDNGIATTGLSRGSIGPVGAWGKTLAESENRPEIHDYVQFDLWNERDRLYPQLQIIARDVKIYQGAALASPDRIWTA